MDGGEGGRPERPERLLVVVDVANIRPRDRTGRGGRRSNGPTSLTFIDLCLSSIQMAAPGAIVVKFADMSLLDVLPRTDREEVRRRSGLHYSEPDKIFLVRYADRPVLTGAHAFEASIVSCDKFDDPELDELKISEVRHFRHEYDPARSTFAFPDIGGGIPLDVWWEHQFGHVPEPWFVSDEYLEIDWQVRSGVHDSTFQYHSEPLTHRPLIPAGAIAGPQEDHDDRPEHDGLAQSWPDVLHGDAVSAPSGVPVRRLPGLRVVFVDDLDAVARLDGSDARVVGRISRRSAAGLVLEWFEGGASAPLVPAPGAAVPEKRTWVSVPCRVIAPGGAVRLEMLHGGAAQVLSFAEVMSLRTASAPAATPTARTNWAVPGFARAFVQLSRLRDRRGSRWPRSNGEPGMPTRSVRLVPVFREGRIDHEERLVTEAEETAAQLEAADKQLRWRLAEAQATEERRRDEASRRREEEDRLQREADQAEHRRRQEDLERRRHELVERRRRELEEQERLQAQLAAERTAARNRRLLVATAITAVVLAAVLAAVLA